MPDGVRDPRRLGYGGEPGGPAYPKCRGLCRGTERLRTETPAKYATRPNGIRGIVCKCCEDWLRRARPGETGISPATTMGLAALSPEVRANALVFVCDRCRYDMISLDQLVPADQLKPNTSHERPQ